LTLSIVNRNTNLRRLFTRNSSRLKVNDIFSDDGSSRRLGGGFNANRPRSLYRRRLGLRLDGGSWLGGRRIREPGKLGTSQVAKRNVLSYLRTSGFFVDSPSSSLLADSQPTNLFVQGLDA
jgi:hypothetical protein